MPSHSSRLFAKGLLGMLVVTTVGLALIYWRIYGASKLFGDFDIFYRAAVNVVEGNLGAVYDIRHIRELLASDSLNDFAFFLNPPTGLFIVYPFGLMPRLPALLLWTLLQIALLAALLRTVYIRRLFGSPSPLAVNTHIILAIAFLAFSLQNILFGQVALLCTALFLAVIALRHRQPMLAGVLLGLFSFKPQLGLLLPVLLAAEKNWKALFCACATALLMALLSLEIWGTGIWRDYGEMTALRARFLTGDQSLLFAISTSAYAALRNLGIGSTVALGCQCALAAAVLKSIWQALRQGEESYKILIVILATYLVSPYSLIYDIPLLAIPCALLLRRAEADRASFYELIALLLLIALPLVALLLQLMHIPYSVVAIGFALGVARRLPMREQVIYG